MDFRNIAIRLAYDGTDYHGWQVQKDAVTVAGTIEAALTKLCKHPVKAVGCGRTDAGVHARMYCANFKTNCKIPAERLPMALNAILPGNISVSAAVETEMDFNSILSCSKKEYSYVIHRAPVRNPFLLNRAWFYSMALDVNRMKEAARAFVGTHDFAAVRSVGTNVKSTVRTIYYYEVEEEDDTIVLRVCANGFLYNMARAMAGSLIYAGCGKILPEEIPALLLTKDRGLMGPTVPPQGLYLTKLWYPGEVGRMMR